MINYNDKFFNIFFIFLCFLNLGFSHCESCEIEKPSLAFSLRRESAYKPFYSWEGELRGLNLRGRRVNLCLQGGIKKEKNLTIIKVNRGKAFFRPSEVKEFSSYLVYKKDTLTLTYLKGEGFIITGKIEFSSETSLDLNIDVKGVSLKELNKFLGVANFPFQGDFRGNILVSGKIPNILIEGKLEAFQANLEDYKIGRVFLNFRGSFPWIYFSDSYALLENTSLDLEGTFNLAKLYSLSYPQASSFREFKEPLKESEESTSLRGFLEAKQPGVFIYRLGGDSFLKFSFREKRLKPPEVNF